MKLIAEEVVWISVARAARILGKSCRQVLRYIESGKLIAKRIGPSGWQKVDLDSVVRLQREFPS
jgi:hypothetical protein